MSYPEHITGGSTPQYFDVKYKTPSGIVGVHYAILATSGAEAAESSSHMLSYGTSWHPSEFTVISVEPTPETNKPITQ